MRGSASQCEVHMTQCASGVYIYVRTSIACIGQHIWIQLENVGTGQFEASRWNVCVSMQL